MSDMYAVVLAAGHGKRMNSTLPKVMHPVAGRPLVHYPIRAALQAGAKRTVVVVGHERDRVIPYLARAFGNQVTIAIQHEQKGTGHAAAQALPVVPAEVTRLLIVCGDTPLLRSNDLRALAAALDDNPQSPLAILACTVDDPTGYGRLIRNEAGQIVEICEHKDLRNKKERSIREVNPGVYCARVSFLRDALDRIDSNNAQGEFYLTDIVALAAKREGQRAAGVVDVSADASTLVGVNDRAQLAATEAAMQAQIIEQHRRAGATIREGAIVDDTVEIGTDVVVENGVTLRGTTKIESGAVIDVGCVVADSVVGKGAMLHPYTIVTSSTVEAGTVLGPFAHIGVACVIGEGVELGNFVETKRTTVQSNAVAHHFAYLGDGEIGKGVTVGAGTIFCNDDGYQIHRTQIGPGAFIGSNSKLVAPVTVGADAYVATGTTITRNVPDGALAIGRARQQNKDGYASKLKDRLKTAAQVKNGT